MDYELHIRVKNARLMRAIREAGFASIAAFSRAINIHQTELGKYANLKKSALNEQGRLRSTAQALCDALGKLPEEIFPPEMMEGSISKNTTVALVTGSQARMFANPDAIENVDLLADLSNKDHVARLMEDLSDREKGVIKARFLEEKTFVEVGDEQGVSGNRIAEIQRGAIRKMRNKATLLEKKEPAGSYNPWEQQRREAKRLVKLGMPCNCELDNWEPERETGHSWVCRIHKAAMQRAKT